MKKMIFTLSIATAFTIFSNTAIAEAVAYENGSAIPATNGAYGVIVDRSLKGVLTMTRTGLPSITCNAKFDGNVEIDADGQVGRINVTGVNLTNPSIIGLCGTVTVSDDFSSENILASDLASYAVVEKDVDVKFTDVSVNLCNGGIPNYLEGTFNNEVNTSVTPPINSAPSKVNFDDAPLTPLDGTPVVCRISGYLLVDGDDLDVVNQ